MNSAEIISKLAQIRVAKGISQYELSMRLGKSHTYIHDVEKGKNKLTFETFLTICKELEVEPKTLF